MVTLTDISEAFDKKFGTSVKYNILRFQLPPIIESLPCDFLDDKEGKIETLTLRRDL